jgi:dolichol-phosphate mannosyltransferase
MKLSIIIPVHNEEKFIQETLSKVFGVALECEKEVIVVNDGSTDGTAQILKEVAKKYDFKLMTHGTNRGKGSAIKTGLELATGDAIIVQDADLEYDPKNIPALLAKLDPSIWAVYGRRSGKVWPERGLHYILGAKLLTWAINTLYDSSLHDTYTGYKLFNLEKVLELLRSLKSTGFEFEAEITCKILKAGGEIIETPIDYIPRSVAEGKHIGWLDGVKGLLTIIGFRFRK